MIVCYFEAVAHESIRARRRATLREFFEVLRDAIWALMMAGHHPRRHPERRGSRATEAGVAAVSTPSSSAGGGIATSSGRTSPRRSSGPSSPPAVVMFLVATSTLFAWLITVERIPQEIAATMLGWDEQTSSSSC
jgi:TRAP-type C4-dicarboxylate transport system permease large subunit